MKSKILRCLISSILIFSLFSFSASSVSAASLQTVTKTNTYTRHFTGTYTDMDIEYWITGKYVYNYNTGKISSASATTGVYSITLTTHGSSQSYYINSTSATAKIASNGYSVNFTASWLIHTFQYPMMLNSENQYFTVTNNFTLVPE